jgi:hypothetical protein
MSNAVPIGNDALNGGLLGWSHSLNAFRPSLIELLRDPSDLVQVSAPQAPINLLRDIRRDTLISRCGASVSIECLLY